MTTALLAFGSVVAVSAVSLAGLAALSLDEARLRRIATPFVSFAVGALLGDAFIHLVPEALARAAGGTLGASHRVLAGMVVFFVVEKIMRRRHGLLHAHAGEVRVRIPHVAAINVVGDAVHNFIDGVLIGASYLAGTTVGVATTAAVLLHELPQELGDFSVLVHSGLGVRKAVLWNGASAATAIAGTAAALGAGAVAGEAIVGNLIPFAAGGFVYLAAADLVPELQHDRSMGALFWQTGLIVAGIAVMSLLATLG